MFEISTEGEEKAYRLGYIEAWADVNLWALTLGSQVAGSPRVIPPDEIYHKMRDYQVDVLRPWFRERAPKINETPPEFVVS